MSLHLHWKRILPTVRPCATCVWVVLPLLSSFSCVTPVVVGRVLDVKGRPVSGAAVALEAEVRGDRLQVSCTETDRDGRFSCDKLPDRKAAQGDRVSLKIGKSGYDPTPIHLELPVERSIDVELKDLVGQDDAIDSTPPPINGRQSPGRPPVL